MEPLKIETSPAGRNQCFLQTRQLFSFGALPFVVAGLSDGINLFAVANLLIFVLILLYIGHDRRKLLWFGVGFIFAVFHCWSFYTLEKLNTLLSVRVVFFFQIGMYYATAFAFILIGIVSFIDWWIYRKTRGTQGFLLKLPLFISSDTEMKNSKEKVLLINKSSIIITLLISYLSGLFLTFFSTLWPPHANVSMLLYQFSLPGNLVFAFHLAMLYCLFYIAPIIVVFFVFLLPRLYSLLQKICQENISTFKIVNSGIFLSMGTGLLYFVPQVQGLVNLTLV